jgi:hypothetical protein
LYQNPLVIRAHYETKTVFAASRLAECSQIRLQSGRLSSRYQALPFRLPRIAICCLARKQKRGNSSMPKRSGDQFSYATTSCLVPTQRQPPNYRAKSVIRIIF